MIQQACGLHVKFSLTRKIEADRRAFAIGPTGYTIEINRFSRPLKAFKV